ncbi:MAG: dephospho-CoA kinase [Dehalococcoidia bacterium]|nr:dephospho-CoA kinase [Dehalococcoidia bacterium]
MLIIGLTGTIGSGKSTIAGFMQDMGAPIIDADKIGHEVYLPHSFGWQKVVAAFGESILSQDKSIDRQNLGEIVFNDPDELKRLNHIVHPLIIQSIKDVLEELRRNHAKIVVLDAALLIEAGLESLADEIWVTTAPENVLYKRLSTSRNLTSQQIRQRIDAHMPAAKQIKYATRVIDTNVPLDELKAKIALLWEEISIRIAK